jgi:hypothetical protein
MTMKEWVPSSKLAEVNCTGLVQALNEVPSSEHSRWSIPTPPVSLPENLNITALDLVLLLFPIVTLLPSMAELIIAVGEMVSTFQVNDAGEGSLFVELSTDKTSKV